MGQTNTNLIPASQGLNLGSSAQRWSSFIQNQDVAGTSTVGTETVATLTASRIANIRYADQFGTIQAALADLAGPGTVYVPSGYSEVVTYSIVLSSQRLIVDPAAAITLAVNGQIILGTNGVLDAAGATITSSWTVGNALQINSGFARVVLAKLIGPGTGSGNGLSFEGAQCNGVSIGSISGFGGVGLRFNCVGVSSVCDNNWVDAGHIYSNGTGILFTNQHTAGDGEVQNNFVRCGLVGGNTNAEVQFGDSGTYNAPAGSAQGNMVFGFADPGAAAHAGVTFLNASYNMWMGQVNGPTHFSITNSFLNTIFCPTASLADMAGNSGQVWISGNGLQSSGLVTLPNSNPLNWFNSTGIVKAVLDLDNLNNVVMFGETTTQRIAFQANPGVNTMSLEGVGNAMKLFGKITEYNSIGTVNGGVPSELAAIDLVAQTAAIATATLYAVPGGGAGQFRLSWNAKIMVVASTGAATSTLGPLTIAYTDPDGIVITLTSAAVISAGTVATNSTANTTGTVLAGIPQLLNCKASTAITYAFAYASNTAAQMAFNLHISLEDL